MNATASQITSLTILFWLTEMILQPSDFICITKYFQYISVPYVLYYVAKGTMKIFCDEYF